MSPAPYPPLHAGDDVDADFFDQLGDEVDFPAHEVVPQKHQDVGLVNLSDPPGELHVSSGAAAWSSPPKVHPEEVGLPLPQEGNSQADLELEEALTNLNLENQEAQSISHGDNHAHLLSNGDELGLHHSPVEAVHDSEDRVTGDESSVFDSTTSTTHLADDNSVAELSIREDSAISTIVPSETAGVKNVEPESRLLPELSFSTDLAAETVPIVEEESKDSLPQDQGEVKPSPLVLEEAPRDTLPQDQGKVKPSEASKVQAQTTEVEEVQWSNFGAQGGFGSFSDFLSVYPADSSEPQDVNAVASSSESDLFHFGEQSISDIGSNVVAPQCDDVSFFDLHQPHEKGGTETPDCPPQSSRTDYETLAPVQVNSGEIQAHVHLQELEQQVQDVQFDPGQWQNTESQGQEQQVQSDQVDHSQWNNLQSGGQVQQTQFGQLDQGIWQELAEYPGWLYNTLTGEWVEKNNNDVGAGTATSWDYSSGQDSSYYRGVENENTQSHGAEWLYDEVAQKWVEKINSDAGVGAATSQDYPLEQEPSQDRGGDNETILWQSHEVTGNAPDENGLQADPHLGQSMAETSVIEWTGNQGNAVQTNNTHNPLSLETVGQQNNSAWQESSGEAATSVSQSGWEDQYPGWYFDHHAQEWKQYSQLPQVAEEVPNSTSLPPVSYEQTTHLPGFSEGYNAEGFAGQGLRYNAGGQFAQDLYGNLNVVPSSLQTADRMATQAEISGQWTGVQAQQFENTSSYYPSGQPVSSGANQQPWNTTNPQQVDPLNSYSAAQMLTYAPQPQPWSMNPYGTAHHPQYVSQTAPKSVEEALRTSVGRPPHALTAFAFGGKLVVMKLKDPLSLQSSDGNQSFASGQAFVPGPIQMHSLSQLVAQTYDNGPGETGSNYFGALSRQTFSGPLIGGSVSNKELNKWLDDQAGNCVSEGPNFRSPGSLPMLWGLLKLSCKHYGELRSQSGLAGVTSQVEDSAEAALAKLLTSGGDQSSWTMGSFSSTVCLQPMPSEHQLQVTASETKKLLVAGKRKEALKNAQQGQLWGTALVLARQLGEKYYADTVAAMAQRQFLPGSPLRTLSLLIAGQPAEVFSENNTLTVPGNQPMQVPSSSGNITEGGLGSMLEEWQENLSIMAANRTNGDDRVISHLGDCLWKVKGEVAAAHICYLVADANFESFSSSARLCLVGADHWKHPRTYASPEAIQRTEVYEYSKILGNSQFFLVTFQPYKLIYASMLAEAGKAAEALRYCQAVLKTLKTASRAPEVETCRLVAASLEERLRIHMQGGSSVNLAPGKLLRGVFSAFDRTVRGVIGGPPPPTGQEQLQMAPTIEPLTLQNQLGGPRFGGSPSRPLAPLGPSASAEKFKESGRSRPQRSVSEPDFSSSMKEKAEQGKPLTRGGYLGRFCSVFSKAGGIVSMVSKTGKKEAKLGDVNKFYYDEKLKRWVEEGADAPQEEAALPPPPISANFVSKVDEASSPDTQFGVGQGAAPPSASKSAYLGTPPVPPSNQFSARARQQGVRSRYVDTFNKSANSTTPSKPAVSVFGPAGKFGGTPLQPMNSFVPASSMDSMNGPILNSENGTSLVNREENHVGHHSESSSNTRDRLDANQQSVVQNVFHQSGMAGSGMAFIPSSENVSAFGTGGLHRVPSSDNTAAFGASEESAQRSGRLGRSPSNGDIGLSNGYHSRANSWSGYPSNFQTSQAEINSSYDNNPATNFSMYNGFSSEGTMNAPPTVGSYFPSPSKADIYNPNASAGLSETFASPPPSMSPFMPGIMGVEARPGELEARSSSQPDVSLVGDDLQEVEL